MKPKVIHDSFGEDADGRRGIKFKTVVCPICGTELDYEIEKCSSCNHKIDWTEDEAVKALEGKTDEQN